MPLVLSVHKPLFMKQNRSAVVINIYIQAGDYIYI